MRLDIRKIAQLKDGDELTGSRTRVKVVKNKVAPPFKMAEFDILYGEGISALGELIDLGVEFGVIKKAGSWFSYGTEKLGQGRESVKKILREDPVLYQKIHMQVKELMTGHTEIISSPTE